MHNDLQNIGIKPHKDRDPSLIEMSDVQFKAFLLGWSDGDGCLCIDRRNRFAWNLIVPKSLKGCIDRMQKLSGIHITIRDHWRSTHLYQISIGGNTNVFSFLRWLYDGQIICLDRKHKKFMEMEEYYSRQRKGTSKYRGVSRNRNRFVAEIKHHNKKIHIGCFEKEEDAAFAYNKKALEIRGTKAILNKITDYTSKEIVVK